MNRKPSIKLCYILSYYSPRYIRTETLVEALTQLDEVALYQARNTTVGFLRYFETLLKLIWIRFRYQPDIYLLGFRGYEIFWPVRLLTLGKQLIFDHLMSPYDSLGNEQQRFKPLSLADKAIYQYEKSILKATSQILTDTALHQQFFARLFNVPKHKIYPVPVSANEQLFKAPCHQHSPQADASFQIFFYGSFLPLHGVNIILQAAAQLKTESIRFTLVGGHRLDLTAFFNQMQMLGLTNINHQLWIDYEQLPNVIAEADLCLGGPFGNTPQAQRVITGKTFQFLAMGKATVVGQIAQDNGFIHQTNCLLIPQGNADALADAIRWAFQHRADLAQIGQQGFNLYQTRFSIRQIKHDLQKVIQA